MVVHLVVLAFRSSWHPCRPFDAPKPGGVTYVATLMPPHINLPARPPWQSTPSTNYRTCVQVLARAHSPAACWLQCAASSGQCSTLSTQVPQHAPRSAIALRLQDIPLEARSWQLLSTCGPCPTSASCQVPRCCLVLLPACMPLSCAAHCRRCGSQGLWQMYIRYMSHSPWWQQACQSALHGGHRLLINPGFVNAPGVPAEWRSALHGTQHMPLHVINSHHTTNTDHSS